MLNQSGYYIVNPLGLNQPSTFRRDAFNVVHWGVNPLDPGLRKIGIRFLAFDKQPPPEIRQRLKPLAARRISKFWLYELR